MIHLVCGPPCSGKTTHVRDNAGPDDLIIEFDTIAQELGSTRSHHHDYPIGRRAERRVQQLIAELEAGQHTEHPNVWLTRSLPEAHQRQALADRLGATITVLTAPRHVLLERASRRPGFTKTAEAIDWWLDAYTRQGNTP